MREARNESNEYKSLNIYFTANPDMKFWYKKF